MSRFWFLLLTVGVFDVSGYHLVWEYKIMLPSQNLGFEKVGSELHLTQTPGVWFLKQYRSKYFVVQDVITKEVLTKIDDSLNGTVAILPKSKSLDDNQKWFIVGKGSFMSYTKPRLYIEFGKRGSLYLTEIPNASRQTFLLDLVYPKPIQTYENEKATRLASKKPKRSPTRHTRFQPKSKLLKQPTLSPGEYHIFEPGNRTALKNVGYKVHLSKTPSVWIVQENQTNEFIIEDAHTGQVFTRIVINYLPMLFLRAKSKVANDKNQRWHITSEGRILTLDYSPWTVEYTKNLIGVVELSELEKAPHQRFYFKKLKDYSNTTLKPSKFKPTTTTTLKPKSRITKPTSAKTTTTTTRNKTPKPKVTRKPKTAKPEEDLCYYYL